MTAGLGFDDWVDRGGAELDRSGVGPFLEVGASLVARDAYPELPISDVVDALDELTRPLERHALHRVPVDDAARAIAQHLYGVHRFRGNEADYGDPRNSYLNDVLTRKLGLPITLAVVVLGVARRLGVPARGVSFPGHFLVRFDLQPGRAASPAGASPLVIDPFRDGRALGVEELTRLLRRAAGPHAHLQAEHLEPASTRAIVVRMLQNVKAAHVARGDLPRALVAATRICTLVPREASAIRDRGVLQAQLGAPLAARADLVRYLELSPKAGDASNIRKILETLPAKGVRAPN